MADVTRALGHGVVKVRLFLCRRARRRPAVLTWILLRAVFRPGEGDGDGQTFTNRRTARRTQPAQGEGTPVVPATPALTFAQGDPFAAGVKARRGPGWINGPSPRALANDPGTLASLIHAPGGDLPADIDKVSRHMRSAQSDCSYNSAIQYLDISRGAVDAAVRDLTVSPVHKGSSRIGDWANVTNWLGSPLPKMQPPTDLTEAGAGNAEHVLADGLAPIQFVQGVAPEPPGNVGRASPAPGQGVAVVLPNGLTVPDAHSVTGHMVSPVIDLAPVAAAGRRTGQTYRAMLDSPESSGSALPYLAIAILTNVGQGVYDYQRQGNHIIPKAREPYHGFCAAPPVQGRIEFQCRFVLPAGRFAA
jgi:hypothetical protein